MKKEKGFSLVELLCVLVILVILILLVSRNVLSSINEAKDELSDSQKKSVLNAAEKWFINNMDIFNVVSEENVPLDIVFVVDSTRTMKEKMSDGKIKAEAAVEAINETLDMLSKNGNTKSRVGFVFFTIPSTSLGKATYSGSGTIRYQTNGLISINEFINNSSNSLKFSNNKYQLLGKTVSPLENLNYSLPAVQTAANLLLNKTELDEVKRIPVIIYISDGIPLYGNTDDLTENNYLTIKNSNYGITRSTWCWSTRTMNELQALLATQSTTYKQHVKGKAEDNCDSFGKNKLNGTASSTYTGYCPVDWVLSDWNTNKTLFSSEKTSKTILNVIQTFARAKKEISAKYDASMYIYTVGLDVKTEYGRFMLNTGEKGLEDLKNAENELNGLDKKTYAYFDTLWHVDVGLALYDTIKNVPKESYDYVTKAFINPSSSEELLGALQMVATDLNEKAMMSNVCVKVEDLQEEGYLKKNVKLSKNLAADTSVIISFNDSTNQFSYSIAGTADQIKACDEYYAKQNAKKENE